MGAMASQIISVSIVCTTVGWSADQRKYQSSASLTFVGISRGPVNSPHKVTRKIFPFDDVIMWQHFATIENGSRPLWLTTFQRSVVLVMLQWKLCKLWFFFSQHEPQHNRDWVGQCYGRRGSSYRAHHHRCGGWCGRSDICGKSHWCLSTENGRGYVCFPVDADFCTASDPKVHVYVQLAILRYTNYTVLTVQPLTAHDIAVHELQSSSSATPLNYLQPVILRYMSYTELFLNVTWQPRRRTIISV